MVAEVVGMNTGNIHDDREVLTMEAATEVVVHDEDDWVRIEEEKAIRFRNMVLVPLAVLLWCSGGVVGGGGGHGWCCF
jgi:hypothetical protein